MGMMGAKSWAVMGMLLLSSGCAHQANRPVDNSDQPYRIGREDVLDVAVWRDGDLSRTLPVRPDGFISLPMVGEVRAEGRTPVELSEQIRESLKPYVQDPRVTVIVREVNSTRVFITGEVAHPGAYPLRGRVSVLQAIALAGGFTDFADRDGIVVLRRQGAEGEPIPVSYSDLVEDAKNNEPLSLRPGDTIVVP
ncbi:polysaccharide biosynthesis/export family protein [Cystobacter ferrugineus]|uniref:Sugar ABC transporter substrate-binding protein n=1 Tax=Cystobacter ferrugineus TaxID=83449 RepID=A0A1L9AVK7_9BACT|nr:polysaccharide biosynthesis/export family protein [Cystobacter ferrugineus]OJH34037.1 sugar ABC transporter substrate-binding protein [Cystobacter ferrugineus]